MQEQLEDEASMDGAREVAFGEDGGVGRLTLVRERQEEAVRRANPGEESERGWAWLEGRACQAQVGRGQWSILS